MEFNIAEIITVAVFVASCAGYIKREIAKLTKKQEKQLEETNQRIDKLQKRVIGFIKDGILENEKAQNRLNQTIVKSIDNIYNQWC